MPEGYRKTTSFSNYFTSKALAPSASKAKQYVHTKFSYPQCIHALVQLHLSLLHTGLV
jgi:hypothetical protein